MILCHGVQVASSAGHDGGLADNTDGVQGQLSKSHCFMTDISFRARRDFGQLFMFSFVTAPAIFQKS